MTLEEGLAAIDRGEQINLLECMTPLGKVLGECEASDLKKLAAMQEALEKQAARAKQAAQKKLRELTGGARPVSPRGSSSSR